MRILDSVMVTIRNFLTVLQPSDLRRGMCSNIADKFEFIVCLNLTWSEIMSEARRSILFGFFKFKLLKYSLLSHWCSISCVNTLRLKRIRFNIEGSLFFFATKRVFCSHNVLAS